MNLASWIILAIVAIWIGIAIKSAFFGGFGRKGRSCHGSCGDEGKRRALPSDEELMLPSACAGCSKGSCSGCPSATRDIPMPTIHEVESDDPKWDASQSGHQLAGTTHDIASKYADATGGRGRSHPHKREKKRSNFYTPKSTM